MVPPPPPPGSGPSTPFNAETPADENASPAIPPPPPPEDEDAGSMIKTEECSDSPSDVKLPVGADARMVSRELKRKWDGDVPGEMEVKKLKEMDDEVFVKPNGIHKAEDVPMKDEAEHGTNGTGLDASAAGVPALAEVANGYPENSKEGV